MEDGYWDLFWQTGLPELYLLRKQKEQEAGKEQKETEPRVY